MKTALFILVGAIGLTGCTTMAHHRAGDGRNEGSPLIYSDRSESYPPADKHVKTHDPYVRDLPIDAEIALGKVGIKNIAFIAVVDRDGTMRLLNPENVKYQEAQFPISSKLITEIRPISIVTYKNSHCFIWSDGTIVDRNNNVIKKSSGSPTVSGGTGYARFCLAYWN